MNDREINEAIAKACGWTATEKGWWKHADYEYQAECPDYCNDLNAMHEAEKSLLKNDAVLWRKYAKIMDESYINQPYTIGANAGQRAEAFLKTMNLWEQ